MDLSINVGEVHFNFRVGLIIVKENKVLLERDPRVDFCLLPGGRVKTLETTIDAIIREIKEEMAVDLVKDELTFNGIVENFFTFKDQKNHELLFVYKIEVQDDRFDLCKENLDSGESYYQWVDINDLASVNLLPVACQNMIHEDKINVYYINDIN